jgi:hypothetical protein
VKGNKIDMLKVWDRKTLSSCFVCSKSESGEWAVANNSADPARLEDRTNAKAIWKPDDPAVLRAEAGERRRQQQEAAAKKKQNLLNTKVPLRSPPSSTRARSPLVFR